MEVNGNIWPEAPNLPLSVDRIYELQYARALSRVSSQFSASPFWLSPYFSGSKRAVKLGEILFKISAYDIAVF